MWVVVVVVLLVILAVAAYQVVQNRKETDTLDLTGGDNELLSPEEIERRTKREEDLHRLSLVCCNFDFPHIETFNKAQETYENNATPDNKENVARALVNRTIAFVQKQSIYSQTRPFVMHMRENKVEKYALDDEQFEDFQNALELLKAEEADISMEANELKATWGDIKQNRENIFVMSRNILNDQIVKIQAAKEQAIKEGRDPNEVSIVPPQGGHGHGHGHGGHGHGGGHLRGGARPGGLNELRKRRQAERPLTGNPQPQAAQPAGGRNKPAQAVTMTANELQKANAAAAKAMRELIHEDKLEAARKRSGKKSKGRKKKN
jgi:hypothetical protein